ncbi:MAG: diguanylate cyclase, partial [Deltaproteobacteria bacterium]|nr:diguanylate cyclase [Deltaproteobacteria bacterium]
SYGMDLEMSSQVTALPVKDVPWTTGKKTQFIPRGEVAPNLMGIPEQFRQDSFWVPLISQGNTVGRLVIQGLGDKSPDSSAQEFLRLVAIYAGSMVANTRLYDALQKRLEELTTLFEVGKALSSTLELDRVLRMIVDGITSLTGVRSCSIMLLDHSGQRLKIRSARGVPEEVVKTAVRELGEGISGKVAQTGKPIYLRDVKEARGVSGCNSKRYRSPSLICVPLKSRGRIIGVLNANDKAGGDFTPEDLNLVTLFANNAAVAIDNAAMHDQLWKSSVTDGLTKTYVHTYFEQQLQRKVEAAIRQEGKLAVIMLDLDHFKKINDQYGHQVGDDVLRQVARLLRKAVRSNDLVARYGGEEFVLILTDVPARIVLGVAERLRAAVERSTFTVDPAKGGKISITASFGIAMLPNDASDAKSLVKVTDDYMYKSKESGRNRVTCSESVAAEAEKETAEMKKTQGTTTVGA